MAKDGKKSTQLVTWPTPSSEGFRLDTSLSLLSIRKDLPTDIKSGPCSLSRNSAAELLLPPLLSIVDGNDMDPNCVTTYLLSSYLPLCPFKYLVMPLHGSGILVWEQQLILTPFRNVFRI